MSVVALHLARWNSHGGGRSPVLTVGRFGDAAGSRSVSGRSAPFFTPTPAPLPGATNSTCHRDLNHSGEPSDSRAAMHGGAPCTWLDADQLRQLPRAIRRRPRALLRADKKGFVDDGIPGRGSHAVR